MVQLSPKALRFAEFAAEEAADRHALAHDELRMWENWRANRDFEPHRPGPQHIPKDAAAMFLHAIDRVISLEIDGKRPISFIEDGNDLELLKAIKDSLALDLRLDKGAPFPPRR
ncbi:hypothetical protein [Acidisoma silvae]|uniref:Uncharacterized protein n=1 Tax=Acidisoma silvae TaxID=2802396 RepID=A0A963YNP1_9PROT|nr:hypothetical protein [Acidisoma silvae]MCB8874057.1 hypothetical protein [Acidisoma silvae]